MISTTELNLLYYMTNNQKLDVSYAIAVKLKDVANKRAGAIKVRGLVTTIANHLGFNVDNMPFDKVKGKSLTDIEMMMAIGMVTRDNSGNLHLIHNPPPLVQM